VKVLRKLFYIYASESTMWFNAWKITIQFKLFVSIGTILKFPYLFNTSILGLALINGCSISNVISSPTLVHLTSVRILAKRLGLNNRGASKIINDLVVNNFLIRDKSKFCIKVKAWDYKPVYDFLDVLIINRKYFNEYTDKMLNDNSITGLYGDACLYKDVVYKLKLDISIYDFISNISIHPYHDENVHPGMRASNNDNEKVQPHFVWLSEHGENVPYQVIGKIPTKLISVYNYLQKNLGLVAPIKIPEFIRT
jgi:hypothetical protein